MKLTKIVNHELQEWFTSNSRRKFNRTIRKHPAYRFVDKCKSRIEEADGTIWKLTWFEE